MGEFLFTDEDPLGDGPASAATCIRCESTPADGPCCSAHDKQLCHACYRRTHFVEVCGCSSCEREGLPRIYPPKAAEAARPEPTNPDRVCRRCRATSGLRLVTANPLTMGYRAWECWDGCRDTEAGNGK